MKPLDPRLLQHAKAARTHVAVCVLLGVGTAALILVQAELLATGISRVVAGGDRAAISGVLVALAVVFASRAAIAWMQDSAAHRSAAVVTSQLRRKVVTHAARSATTDTKRAEVATLATRGIDALDPYLGRYLPQLVLAAIVPLVVLGRLVLADGTAAVTVALTLPLIPVFMALVGLGTEASTSKRWQALQRLSHHFLDVVAGLPTLQLFGRAKAQPEAVRQVTDRYRTTTMATLRIAFLSSLVLELLATLSVALVAVGVGLRLVDGGLDLRTGLLVIILAPEAYLPLRQVGAQYHAAADGVAAAEQAFAILEQPLVASGTISDVPDLRAGGALHVRELSVAHPGRDGFAPDRATVEASAGELVVLTGESGAGKSTLLAALLGAVPPDHGGIVVHGGGRSVALADLATDAWRTNLAWVDQRPFLFAGTVADNVRLSRPEASDAEVRRALAAAGLPAGMAGRDVGESGQHLSSGERRRVAFARAVLRDAPVVLLDEPTAGLDEATEADLLHTVRALATDRIVVMVSHRPAAIAVADRVVEIRAGMGAEAPNGGRPARVAPPQGGVAG
jgi:thiol reductant ABC exporter CydD subunit